MPTRASKGPTALYVVVVATREIDLRLIVLKPTAVTRVSVRVCIGLAYTAFQVNVRVAPQATVGVLVVEKEAVPVATDVFDRHGVLEGLALR